MSKVKELEMRLAHAEAQLHLHQSISRLLAKSVNLPEALDSVLKMVAEFTHADSCLLYLFTQGELVLCAARGPNPAAVGEVRLRLEEGLTGWVARERRLLAISREAYHDPRFKYFSSLPEDSFEAFLSVPILTRNRVVGVINLQHRQPHSHTGEEMEMLTMVGQQVGALITLASLDAEKFVQLDFAELVLGARVGAPES